MHRTLAMEDAFHTLILRSDQMSDSTTDHCSSQQKKCYGLIKDKYTRANKAKEEKWAADNGKREDQHGQANNWKDFFDMFELRTMKSIAVEVESTESCSTIAEKCKILTQSEYDPTPTPSPSPELPRPYDNFAIKGELAVMASEKSVRKVVAKLKGETDPYPDVKFVIVFSERKKSFYLCWRGSDDQWIGNAKLIKDRTSRFNNGGNIVTAVKESKSKATSQNLFFVMENGMPYVFSLVEDISKLSESTSRFRSSQDGILSPVVDE